MKEEVFTAIGWQRLRDNETAASADLGIPSLELDVGTKMGAVRLALGADNAARFLVPLAAGDPFPMLADTHGLELKDNLLLLRGKPVRFLELACRDRQLEDVFQKLVADVLRRLAGGVEASVAVEGAISDFRNLLIGAGRARPSMEAALGLVGELLVLNRLLEKSDSAWKLWTGPLGARHDFRAGDLAMEVKTCMRAQRRIVEISALDQLAEPEGGSLVLAHHILEYDAAGRLSVSDEAEKALARASDQAELAERLGEAGYVSDLKEQWSAFRFSLLARDYYAVRDGFPRLTPSSFAEGELPTGVSHFRYRVDLGAATQFRLRPADVDDFLGKILS